MDEEKILNVTQLQVVDKLKNEDVILLIRDTGNGKQCFQIKGFDFRGESAYEAALSQGFEGTYADWQAEIGKTIQVSAAIDAANKATLAANTAASNANTAADAAKKASSKATDAADSVKSLLDAFASTNPYVGFARVSGDADPTPTADYMYGSRALIREIGSHIKLGTVKRVDNEAVLQHECAKGRITLATNGDEVAVDGTEGDLLVYTDIPLYLLKANEVVNSKEMSCMGVGVVPCYWQNHAAKRLDCFGISPFYTTNCKLEGDEREQAHCVITDKAVGTYTAPNGFFQEVFKANGAGYPSLNVSALGCIHQAQNKNADPNTNFPYMGCYYEFYELMLAMMYAECGTLNTTDIYSMGVGCTIQEIVNDSTWNNEQIAANSGIKYFNADGSVTTFGGIMQQHLKQGANGGVQYNIAALVGNSHYGFTKNGEVLSLLDGITKAGLQASIGSAANIFYYDDNNNVVCSSDGSINLTTGEGMVANKRYYIVRNVPNCEGIAEGVMTAVVNCYVKMNVSDNIYVDSTDLTGGYAIIKFSHSIYRGMSIPLDGLFRQLSGAYYVSGQTTSGYYDNFYCADKWQDVAPLTDDTGYGDIGTEFNILQGLSKKTSVPGNDGWVSKVDYSQSLFCFKALVAGEHTYEVAYTWNSHYIWGFSYGLPALGKEGVKAFVVGCSANNAKASARTVAGSNAVSDNHSNYAGAFAVLELKLKQQ